MNATTTQETAALAKGPATPRSAPAVAAPSAAPESAFLRTLRESRERGYAIGKRLWIAPLIIDANLSPVIVHREVTVRDVHRNALDVIVDVQVRIVDASTRRARTAWKHPDELFQDAEDALYAAQFRALEPVLRLDRASARIIRRARETKTANDVRRVRAAEIAKRAGAL